jgi:methionine synthase II (cobalamin-independent)
MFYNEDDKLNEGLVSVHEDDFESEEELSEDVKDLMENYDLDQESAERVQMLIDEGYDEEQAVELDELEH